MPLLTEAENTSEPSFIWGNTPWLQAIRTKASTIIYIDVFSRIGIVTRDMISNMLRAAARQRRSYRSDRNSVGGRGIDGNDGKQSWQNAIGSNARLSKSRNPHRIRDR
jgi:hypothetical protein